MAVSSEGSGRTNERSSPQRATSTGPPASCSLPLMSCGVHVCKSGNDLEVERLRPGVHVCEDFVARIGDPPERSTGVEGSKLNLFSTSEERQLKLLRLRCLHVRGSPATHHGCRCGDGSRIVSKILQLPRTGEGINSGGQNRSVEQ